MPADSDAAPPFYALTEDDHAALVVVAAIIFFVYALLGIGIKLIIRLNIASMKHYDVILVIAAILFFIQTTCIVLACNSGLGKHQSRLPLEAFARYSKVRLRHNPPVW